MTWLEEKLKNSDYPKFVKLFSSENPRYCFVCVSADRDSGDHEGLSKKKIDSINRRNNRNSLDLMHQLNANGLRFLEAKGHYDEVSDDGIAVPVIERSFIVYSTNGKFLKEITSELGRLYEQDSIFFIDKDHTGEIIWLSDVREMPAYLKGKRTLNFDQSSDVLNYTGLGKNERRFQLDDFKESGFHRNSICSMWYGSTPHILDWRKHSKDGYIDMYRKQFKEWLDCKEATC